MIFFDRSKQVLAGSQGWKTSWPTCSLARCRSGWSRQQRRGHEQQHRNTGKRCGCTIASFKSSSTWLSGLLCSTCSHGREQDMTVYIHLQAWLSVVFALSCHNVRRINSNARSISICAAAIGAIRGLLSNLKAHLLSKMQNSSSCSRSSVQAAPQQTPPASSSSHK
jgi:hypothetical protein